ncbi:CDF family Co(II)/Ni(II) efflux transporter DmeF [Paraperlucidibaca sp.]|jgi:cation diffusion facilitator family transporter|uniref:CDF family Co(II)/Ni(II) efflux transporter DmeF n=1 Tax=Paraperlucidibaca sp. TaxID=2708021 RepID=UPI00398A2E90
MSNLASASLFSHGHSFHEGNPSAERKTLIVVIITAIMMCAEIAGGWIYNSMALLADGWHMSSHTLALGLSLLAYAAARRYANDRRFNFGTWKIEILGGYTSAILLILVAGLMLFQSCERLLSPSPIFYNEAIALASLGLVVNIVCAWLLRDDHTHGHSHDAHEHDDHDHEHGHEHHDLNLRSAYIHVITDAATSVLAIIALIGGKFWGADWLDPIMGIVGAALVSFWAYGLIRDTSRVLLDAEMDAPIVKAIEKSIASMSPHAELTDLHVWRVAQKQYACIVSVVAEHPLSVNEVKQALMHHHAVAHISVEINAHLPQSASLK